MAPDDSTLALPSAALAVWTSGKKSAVGPEIDGREEGRRMIPQQYRKPPEPWRARRGAHFWLLPLHAFGWGCDWMAYLLSRWSFLEVLNYLGSFSVLIAVIFYFLGSGDRLKQKHYQAWQVINTAQGKGGSGGRIDALQGLDADGVPLVGVDVSSAFLQGIRLPNARLLRSNFNAADVRNSDFQSADFSYSDLQSANFRDSNFRGANLQDADLSNGDFCRASFQDADLSGTTLDSADLGHTDLTNIKWQQIKSIKGASIAAVRNPPDGFVAWATQHGAITAAMNSDCP